MANNLKQPKIEHYIHWLGDLRYFEFGNKISYTEETLKKADIFFEKIKQISPVNENGIKTLWLRAERGVLEDWTDPDEEIGSGEYKDINELKEDWLSWFPNETEWYELSAAEESGRRAVTLKHKYMFYYDAEDNEEDPAFPYDLTEFFDFLISGVDECVEMLKSGEYNKYVEENLPPQHRTGTVVRKHYWDVFPEEREEFFKDISKEDVKRFCELAIKIPEDYQDFHNRISSMTAAEFYHCCALGYAANKYKGCDKSEKEQYYMHADGRDEGMKDLPENDPAAFQEWLENSRWHGGGHPWEVCRGGNSTHISLNVQKDENGYYFWLSGSSVWRTVETVKFFLALTAAGYPVYLSDSGILVDRMLETEKIGIVPDGVFPRYCHSYFPGENIITFMNYPYEKKDDLLRYCKWQPEPEVHLIQ